MKDNCSSLWKVKYLTGAQASTLGMLFRFLDAKTAFVDIQLENNERVVRAFALMASGDACAPVVRPD
jgi:hypothetical protein